MITLDKFLSCVRENAARVREYESGGDGSNGKCDCIGLIIGSLALAGFRWPGVHGSNWAARNAMSTFGNILDAGDMFLGEIVYKARVPGEAKYALPSRYDNSGDLRDYYHVGVVTGIDPLEITHCTSVPGGIQRDSKMGNWRYGGKLKYVNYDEGGNSMEPIYQAKVYADNEYPVKMREQASTKAEVLAKIPQGTIVDVLGIVGSDEGDWGFILYGGQTGYMMDKFLRPVYGGDEDEKTETDGETVVVTRETLEEWEAVMEEMAEALRGLLGKG